MSGSNGTTAGELSRQLRDLRDELQRVKADHTQNDNAFFMCAMALIIFLMQCGFAFLEAGAVRSKNCTNIIIKNVLDSLLAIISYWSVGWALAYGPSATPALEPFFGFSQFFLHGVDDYAKFFFQFVFAATAATIISGAVAERCQFHCFLTYSISITTLTYPVLTHWGWTTSGWMSAGISIGKFTTTYIDFAGSGLVHLCGGTISLLAAYMMGPRIGRFRTPDIPNSGEIKGHSVPFAALGGFILMFGFLAFNGGSTSDISTPGVGQTVARAMINTILSGAFAAIVYLAIHYMRKGKWTVLLTINACLTGMVSACAGCNQMASWGAMLTGIGSAIAYLCLSELAILARIDDPLDAFAVHFGGGLWGLFSACFLINKGIIHAFFYEPNEIGNTFVQLGWQMLCALAIIVWSTVTLFPPFFLLKKLNRFRVSTEVELKGLDIYMHGEAAYPLTAYGHGWENEPNELSHVDATGIQHYEHPEHFSHQINGSRKRIAKNYIAPAS